MPGPLPFCKPQFLRYYFEVVASHPERSRESRLLFASKNTRDLWKCLKRHHTSHSQEAAGQGPYPCITLKESKINADPLLSYASSHAMQKSWFHQSTSHRRKKKQSLLQTKHCNNMVIFVTVTTPKNETLSQHLPTHYIPLLVGGFNPSEKYHIVKLDHFPSFGWKENIFETTT